MLTLRSSIRCLSCNIFSVTSKCKLNMPSSFSGSNGFLCVKVLPLTVYPLESLSWAQKKLHPSLKWLQPCCKNNTTQSFTIFTFRFDIVILKRPGWKEGAGSQLKAAARKFNCSVLKIPNFHGIQCSVLPQIVIQSDVLGTFWNFHLTKFHSYCALQFHICRWIFVFKHKPLSFSKAGDIRMKGEIAKTSNHESWENAT